MKLNHIPYQEEIINREILQELTKFNSSTTPVEDNMIFYTEDDDHENYMIDQRLGLESIERKRWGNDQRKHGKVTRRRGSGTKYPLRKHSSIVEPYRPSPERFLEGNILDIEGNSVLPDKPTESERWVDGEEVPIYGIFSSLFTIVGDYSLETYKDLETIQWELKGLTAQQKLEWVIENIQDIKQEVTFK